MNALVVGGELVRLSVVFTFKFAPLVGAGLFGYWLMNEDICEPAPTMSSIGSWLMKKDICKPAPTMSSIESFISWKPPRVNNLTNS